MCASLICKGRIKLSFCRDRSGRSAPGEQRQGGEQEQAAPRGRRELNPKDYGGEKEPGGCAQRLMAGNADGQGWADAIIHGYQQSARGVGQEVAVPELPEHHDLRVEIAAVGGRGDEAAAFAAAGSCCRRCRRGVGPAGS